MGEIADTIRRLAAEGNSIETISVVVEAMEKMKPQRKPAQPKGTRLTADWQMPQEWIDWALGEFPGMPAAYASQEAAKFTDYWVAKARDNTKLDWERTWHNWVRKAVDDRRVEQERRGITRPQNAIERRRAAIVERHTDGLGQGRERNGDHQAVRGLPLLQCD